MILGKSPIDPRVMGRPLVFASDLLHFERRSLGYSRGPHAETRDIVSAAIVQAGLIASVRLVLGKST